MFSPKDIVFHDDCGFSQSSHFKSLRRELFSFSLRLGIHSVVISWFRRDSQRNSEISGYDTEIYFSLKEQSDEKVKCVPSNQLLWGVVPPLLTLQFSQQGEKKIEVHTPHIITLPRK